MKKLPSIFCRLLTDERGFTLIELLVTISLISIIAVVSTLSLGNYRSKQSLERTLDEMSSVIQDTQKRAITQQDGMQWGVHFQNSASINAYEMFKGASYAVGTSTNHYGLPRGVQFSNPFSSSTYDAIFSGVTGNLSGKKAISLITGRRDNLVGDIIFNTLGKSTQRVESGLVGYWHFDEGTATTAYDASGNGNTGTLTNSPTWQSGSNCEAGSCLSFAAASSPHVNISDNTSIKPSVVTIGAWFNTTDKTLQQKIISKTESGSYSLSLNENNVCGSSNYCFAVYAGGSYRTATSSLSIIANNQWMFGVGTYDGVTVKLYLNGQLAGSNSYTGTISHSSTPLCIGSESTTGSCAGGNYFSGKIDEVRIYNRALTAAEILNQYNDLK